MSQETHQEDPTILAAVDSLEPGRSPFEPLPPGTRDETAETLARLYNEVLGLIPYELDPAAPRPEVKQRLMTAIAGEETQEVAELRAAPIAPPASIPAPAAPPAPSAGPPRKSHLDEEQTRSRPCHRAGELPYIRGVSRRPHPRRA